jgi:hypothetical protein
VKRQGVWKEGKGNKKSGMEIRNEKGKRKYKRTEDRGKKLTVNHVQVADNMN